METISPSDLSWSKQTNSICLAFSLNSFFTLTCPKSGGVITSGTGAVVGGGITLGAL